MKRSRLAIFAFALILSSCGLAIDNKNTELTIRSTSTITIAPKLIITEVITSTPTPIKNCPSLKTDVPPPNIYQEDVENQILHYLNEGGSIQQLIESINQNEKRAIAIDLTDDGIPEISVFIINAYIFGCVNGEYHTLLIVEPRIGRAELINSIDMNIDGLPELVYRTINHGLSSDITAYYSIFEWNGSHFINLLTKNNFASSKVDGGISNQEAWMVNGSEILQDVDGNGTIELLLHGGNDGGYSSCDIGPVRDETHIWMWNGIDFDLDLMELDPPEYRYQVVFDGDEASLTGSYANAEKLYRRAISDDTLLGIEKYYGNSSYCGRGLGVDPRERPNLTAYSKYRIMLILMIINDNTSKTVYQSLQNEYPFGVYGHAYANLAEVVWKEYSQSQDIRIACSLAMQYANNHQEEILQPLGAGKLAYYGIGKQNNSYIAKDVCPF
jgi:hypothetical protein